jgi:DNA-binding IclR family transcriptional regulator
MLVVRRQERPAAAGDTRPKRPVPITRYQVPALLRAFAILDELNRSSFGLTVQEVTRLHKLPYSTAFYLLETMREAGYVDRNDETKKYTIGYKLFTFRERNDAPTLNLRAVARPLMEELTDVTGLTAHLATLETNEAVYIEKTEPRAFIRLNTWIGKRNSLHCTAVGKALLMARGRDEARRILSGVQLVRRTDRTITSLDVFLDQLEESAARGYAIDDGEDEPEGRCVASVIFDQRGETIACLGISGTLSQIELHRLEAFGKAVRNYAQQISARLGYDAARHAAGLVR